MDPETEAKVRRNLFRRFTGRTFLVVSHRLDGLEDFDTLYLMEQGKVRQVGREELLAALGGNASTPRHPGERARRATSFPLVPKLQLGNAIPR
jgi:ABC-type bacteriocin/lantibiotic exporter with double-glycine peptidase domain